jgi:hypothetical protein
MSITTRRIFLVSLILAAALAYGNPGAWADGGDDSGGSNSGSGSSNSGSGSSNSGSGSDGGDSDDDSDDDNDDDDDDDSRSGSESDRARTVVQSGKAVSLRRLKAHLRKYYPGKVLDVRLKHSLTRYTYVVKIFKNNSKVQRLRFDALTLRKL